MDVDCSDQRYHVNRTRWPGPSESSLHKICTLLELSFRGDTQIQAQVKQQLYNYRLHFPFFNCYLCYIFIKSTSVSVQVRQLSGLCLKNGFKSILMSDPNLDNLNLIKRLLIEGLSDPSKIIRKSCGSCISTFISYHSLVSWSDLFSTLLGLFRGDQRFCDGVMHCLHMLVEDNRKEFEMVQPSPFVMLVPFNISMMLSNNLDIRRKALSSLAVCVSPRKILNVLIVNMDAFVKGLLRLCNDNDFRIRRSVMEVLIKLVPHQQYLTPIYEKILGFVVNCLKDDENVLKLLATDFFLECLSNDVRYIKLMASHIQIIVFNVIKGIEYDDFTRNYIEIDIKRELEINNIRPYFHHSTTKVFNKVVSEQTIKHMGECDDDEEDVDYIDALKNDEVEYNLREASSKLLDKICSILRHDILPLVLKFINPGLTSKQWWVKEAAILALGAIVKGSNEFLLNSQETMKMLTFIFNTLQTETFPKVISRSLWTLGRFCDIILAKKDTNLLNIVMKNIIIKIVSKNMYVQEGACGALQVYCLKGAFVMNPYLTDIIKACNYALLNYNRKNLFILYDTISILADQLQYNIKRPDFFQMIISVLIKHWSSIKNPYDDMIIAVVDCLANITLNIKEGCKGYATFVWNKCLAMIIQVYKAVRICKEKGTPGPDKDLINVALDSINALCEALGKEIHVFIEPNFLNILLGCIQDNNNEIKTTAFGLIGEISRSAFNKISSNYLERILNILLRYTQYAAAPELDMKNGVTSVINNFDIESERSLSTLNNVVWSVGIIALRRPQLMIQYIKRFLDPYIKLLQIINLKDTLRQNICITISRLTMSYPDLICVHFYTFAERYTAILCTVKDYEERDHCFQGLCTLIMLSQSKGTIQQSQIVNLFPLVCQAIASYEKPEPSKMLQKSFCQILYGYKNGFKNEWNRYYGMKVPVMIRHKLKQLYNFF